jgi:hypothetical protein
VPKTPGHQWSLNKTNGYWKNGNISLSENMKRENKDIPYIIQQGLE